MSRSSNFIITLIVLLFMLFQQANGQIWKKIKEKTQRKVENTISDKASDKAAEIAANNMDKVLNADINPFDKGVKKKDTSDLPDSYSFGWKYQLQMQVQEKGKKKMVIDYYISPGNEYFGFSMPQMPSVFTVMDSKQHAMVAYMEKGDQPVALAYNFPETVDNPDAGGDNKANNFEDYTVTSIPDKKFMGYNCKGLQLENTQYRVILYYTTEAGVSFSQAVKSDKTNVPPQLKGYMSKEAKGLLTYMNIKDKNNNNKNVTMEGIALKETVLVKSNSNYKFM